MLRLDPDEKLTLGEQDSINLNSTLTSPKTMIELPTNTFVDSLNESSINRRDLSSVFNDEDSEFDNKKLTNLDSVSVKRNPTSNDELSNKNHVDDSIGEGTKVRINQSLQNYLEISLGNDMYHLTKCDKIQITDTTIIKYPSKGGYLLQNWVIECKDKNNIGKKQHFIKSTKTKSPTS